MGCSVMCAVSAWLDAYNLLYNEGLNEVQEAAWNLSSYQFMERLSFEYIWINVKRWIEWSAAREFLVLVLVWCSKFPKFLSRMLPKLSGVKIKE